MRFYLFGSRTRCSSAGEQRTAAGPAALPGGFRSWRHWRDTSRQTNRSVCLSGGGSATADV